MTRPALQQTVNEAPARLLVVADLKPEIINSLVRRSEAFGPQFIAGLGEGTTVVTDATKDGVPLTITKGDTSITISMGYTPGSDAATLNSGEGFYTETRITATKGGIELATLQNITVNDALALVGWTMNEAAAQEAYQRWAQAEQARLLKKLFGIEDDGDTDGVLTGAC